MVARPELFARLGGPARVTVITAPPGSGKTVLLRSWISQADLARDAAWVAVRPDLRDPQRFWLSVVGALRRCARCSALVRQLTTAPDVDGWALVERLLADLASLRDPLWLVIDDVHELGAEALRQLELLIMRAPGELRFVLAARHDVRLGLHRLRLEGELAEIREPDLRFTLAEARELFASAGAELPEPALAMLYERTEGWAAGLRLAALSLAGHPDPVRFAAEFSGSERTVAEYLLAEVLDRQREEVRLLLLRTSILERVNGELADLLTGGSGGERVLQDLEQAGCVHGVAGPGALVVPLSPDVRRHPAAGTAPQRAGGDRRSAPGGLRVARGAGASGGSDPACAGGQGVGACHAAASRSLAGHASGRAGRDNPRVARRVPRRGRVGRCRARGTGRGR
jgi:LuxR family maltose regulon positive regulatory protein